MRAQSPDVGTEAQRESGKRLYVKYRSQCHGEKGDGEGYASTHLSPRPRAFTTGKFKIRTTPSGALPSHQDLVNIIRRGMPYTSMPAWPDLSDEEVSNLAYFITTFSPDFSKNENAAKPVPLPSAPRATAESIALGKKLYEENGCLKCHGTLGRADGPSAPTLKDDWGYPIRAADLTQSWTFRGGSSREDIFRTMSTGLNGTPMPSFSRPGRPSNGGRSPTSSTRSRAAADPAIPTSSSPSTSRSGLSGEGGRELRLRSRGPLSHHRADHGSRDARSIRPRLSVSVQAIDDADSIALLVRWHDMSAQKTGKNGPSVPVPPEEEEEPAAGAAAGEGAAAKGGVFGDAGVAPARREGAGPLCRGTGGGRQAIRVLRRGCGPDSFGDTGGRPQALLHLRRRRELSGPLVLRFGRPQSPSVHRQGKRGRHSRRPGRLPTGVASYDQGEWSVIFKRSLRPDSAAAFSPGTFLPVAFSVWDGFSRERGNRRGLTLGYSIYVEPETVPSAIGPMVRTALVIFAIELALIGGVRWRHGSRDHGKVGDQPAATSA